MRTLHFQLRVCCYAAVVLVSSSCASIFGVEEANCDPAFDPACTAAGSGQDDAGQVEGGQSSSGQSSGEQEDAGDQSSAPMSKEEACELYCEDVTRECSEFPQYLNEGSCRTVCIGMLPVAMGGDGLLQDTLECRAAVAGNEGFFSEDPLGSCQTAGPMGLGCGDECDKYCEYMQRFCPEEFDELADDCVATCRDIPRKEAYVHTTTDYDNTLECRFIHIQLSITVSPMRLSHCEHAAGKSLCVDD